MTETYTLFGIMAFFIGMVVHHLLYRHDRWLSNRVKWLERHIQKAINDIDQACCDDSESEHLEDIQQILITGIDRQEDV